MIFIQITNKDLLIPLIPPIVLIVPPEILLMLILLNLFILR